jgi:hypothetical protein
VRIAASRRDQESSSISVSDPSPFRVRPADLAAVVLLAGAVRQSRLSKAARRSRMDLPLSADSTLGTAWLQRMNEFRDQVGRADLPLLIATNTLAGTVKDLTGWRGTTVRMDTEEPRGSGGALRDAVLDLDPSAHVLVAPAHARLRAPLESVVRAMASSEGDVVVHVSPSGTPTGFFRIRCGALAGLPSRGFVDLKEQALPQLAARFDVRVVSSDDVPMPVRSLDGYVRAVRDVAGGAGDGDGEEWRSTFSLVEPGASVAADARLHDSIVLAGGRVESGAVVVRCLVGPGGVVRAGRSEFDELISAGEAA